MLEPLDEEALQRILVEPRNALVKQYQKLFELEGISLEFTQDAIEYIAEKALEFKLGARDVLLVLLLLGTLYVGNSYAFIASLQVVSISLASIIAYLYPAIVAVTDEIGVRQFIDETPGLFDVGAIVADLVTHQGLILPDG